MCGRLLPETLERILYLDTDIIIRGSLESFYYKEFRGKTLIGILDLIGVRYYKEQHYLRLEQIGLSRDDIYVNSGVLLFNLVKMRESFVPEEFLRQTQEKRDVIEMVDQDMCILRARLERRRRLIIIPSLYSVHPLSGIG